MPSLRTVKFPTDFSKITAANAEYSFALPRNRKLVRRKYSKLDFAAHGFVTATCTSAGDPGSFAPSPSRAWCHSDFCEHGDRRMKLRTAMRVTDDRAKAGPRIQSTRRTLKANPCA